MRQIGVVESVQGQEVRVRIVRSTSCGGNCGECSAGCVPTEKVTLAVNQAGAKAGERVVLEMATRRVLLAAVLVYALPILALIAGAVWADGMFSSDILSVLVGFLALSAVFVVVKFVDSRLQKKYTLIAVSVLS